MSATEFKPGRVQVLRDRFNMLFSTGHLRIDLPVILGNLRASAPLEERVESLESLLAWIRLPLNPGAMSERENLDAVQSRNVRFRFVLLLLSRHLEWGVELGAVVASVMRETSGVRLFCHTGMSQETGFFSELLDRLLRRILPSSANESDLAEIFSRIFTDEEDANWIESSFVSVIAPTWKLLRPELSFPSLSASIRDALVVLGAQAAALGVSDEIRSRLTTTDISESPFIELSRVLSQSGSTRDFTRDRVRLLESISRCNASISAVLRRTEESGVSVSLVFKLEKIGASLNRIQLLMDLLEARNDEDLEKTLPRLLASLIREEVSSRSVRGLLHANLHLLARKVVERTGHKGEHYIARTRGETLAMLGSAAGGGALTVVTALLKLVTGHAHLALFFEGFFSWINYAGSFILMQAWGFTLATKQPSMTASALAGTLETLSRTQSSEAVTVEISAIVRSQAAAAIGNIGAVIPAAMLVEYGWHLAFGESLMDAEYARHFIQSLDPVTSLTLPFAALTGVYLWLSSICAGWLENWVVYRRVPQAIARSRRLARVFGTVRVERWSKSCAATASGLAGNISLGFFLAFTSIFGRFFGLPLDVRHVTLSSGALTLAFCSIGPSQLHWPEIVSAVFGIIFIGILNFGVSFVLALEVAARSREIPRKWMVRVLRSVILRFLRSPMRFLFPSSRGSQE